MWVAASLFGVVMAPSAVAQARYDDEDPRNRFAIRIGGFQQSDIDSTIRIDSNNLGLGAVIKLEDTLDIDNEVTVGRIEGFFRFNPRHRLTWTHYQTKREGRTTILEEIQIGDTLFTVGSTINTEWKTTLLKLGWAYSFINVSKYEFYVGFGLNLRRTQLEFDATVTGGGGGAGQADSEDVNIPLPVVNLGGRYNFGKDGGGKASLNFNYEVFTIKAGDFSGSLQDLTIIFEHDTFKHVGFGGGLSDYTADLELEDTDFSGELESSYTGLLLYLKAHF
jgi:hypothetical protein